MSHTLATVAIFIVATLYSMVGHGGASGYLAVLSLTGLNHMEMASTALVLNVLVATLSSYAYARAGHLKWRLALPFVILSIPCAFVGGLIHIPDKIYESLLVIVLLYSAWRLLFFTNKLLKPEDRRRPSKFAALVSGALLGLLSGMVGIGGGIFLSPLLLFKRWATPQETSAIAALFIVVNSFAGIAGRITGGHFSVASCEPYLVAALLGGALGSHLGANRLSREAVCRVLAAVLMTAVCKMAMIVVS